MIKKIMSESGQELYYSFPSSGEVVLTTFFHGQPRSVILSKTALTRLSDELNAGVEYSFQDEYMWLNAKKRSDGKILVRIFANSNPLYIEEDQETMIFELTQLVAAFL